MSDYKVIQLVVPRSFADAVEAEAKAQRITPMTFVRRALRAGFDVVKDSPEQKLAHKLIMAHFEDDRNEIRLIL